MRNLKIVLLSILAPLSFSYAQDAEDTNGVAKSIFNVQTGPVGLWVSHEARLSAKFALRSEIGIDTWALTTTDDESYTYVMPSISFEPRWYYNIVKRAGKGKHIENNSANFLTVSVEYISGGLAMGEDNGLKIPEILTIIPKWGMRRAIAKSNFNYELGGGIGYQGYIINNEDVESNSTVGLDLHIRVGYTF